MNKKVLVGLVFIVVGLTLSGVAVWRGGLPGELYWNNGPIYLSDQDEKGTADITPDQVTTGKQDVTALDVTTKDADVILKRGEHFAVLTDPAEKTSVTVSAIDGTVKVTGDEKNNWSFGIKNHGRHQITVIIPEKFDLKNVSLSNTNGDIHLSKLETEEIQIGNVNGDVLISDSKVSKSGNVENRNGDIIVKNSTLPKLKGYSRFGDLNITNNYQNVTADQAVLSFRNLNGDISLT
ncbi:DUF4097 family beta strand repeat protein [Fructobacillus sp. CRL 2054]|uniref:DUF4097 family beta strand repeat-containing protein n=1 Tax=Fructobacillus sp. CRL 2054 TaxID=2763007 RepID=UPI00237841F5|nr:DUF4097 family beta strand repeat-containing protein [Fructobacillus sp. CRL 2054]MDD9138416.1 DUF4097 family beta strand repeat protein [Fructobacillus sp. CRL 2054]